MCIGFCTVLNPTLIYSNIVTTPTFNCILPTLSCFPLLNCTMFQSVVSYYTPLYYILLYIIILYFIFYCTLMEFFHFFSSLFILYFDDVLYSLITSALLRWWSRMWGRRLPCCSSWGPSFTRRMCPRSWSRTSPGGFSSFRWRRTFWGKRSTALQSPLCCWPLTPSRPSTESKTSLRFSQATCPPSACCPRSECELVRESVSCVVAGFHFFGIYFSAREKKQKHFNPWKCNECSSKQTSNKLE